MQKGWTCGWKGNSSTREKKLVETELVRLSVYKEAMAHRIILTQKSNQKRDVDPTWRCEPRCLHDFPETFYLPVSIPCHLD